MHIEEIHHHTTQLIDLNYPLTANCRIEFLPFNDPESKRVLWHTTAHFLGGIL